MTTDNTPRPRRAAECPIKLAARRMVVERGHLGITNELLQHATQRSSARVGTALAVLALAGEIHGVQVQGHRKHFFANAELAQRWASATPPQPKGTPKASQNITISRNQARCPPVMLGQPRSTVDAPAQRPASVRVQRCPSPTHDARYQCAPNERPHGAGFAAVGLGRDVETGKAWGRSA